ncbi:MAG TPA: ABC transporter permease [Blastocatellia bacterium]
MATLLIRHFGPDPGNTVVGVAPDGFSFPSQASQIWVPLVFPDNYLALRGTHLYAAVGRLGSGVALDQATSEMKSIASEIERENPGEQTGRSLKITPLKDDMVVAIRPALLVLLGAVAAVLLICCVNVASLMLTTAAARRRETVVRAALGAGRWRLVRQFLTESLLLSLIGGAMGALLARPALKSLLALASSSLPRSSEVSVDWRVLGFTLALSVITGIAFGTVPALLGSRTDLREALSEGARSSAGGASHRLRQGLVVAEIALSLALLIGAGLMIKSFIRLQQVDTGINAENVITMQFSLPDSRYKTDQNKIEFFKQAIAKIEAVPGVESAGLINLLPLQEWGYNGDFGIEGRPPDAPGAEPIGEWRAVSPGYFRTLGIPLLSGRWFSDQDGSKSPDVVVINDAVAKFYFPDEDPVGKNVVIGKAHIRIIGVVGDVRESALTKPVMPTLFLSCQQSPLDDGAGAMSLVIRGRLDPRLLISSVRDQILAVDAAQPIYSIKTMSEVVADSSSDSRLNVVLLGAFASLALLLGSIGIYGVISSHYVQRTREIGIRMALGALPSRIEYMALRQGAALALIGTIIGLGLAVALTRTLSSLLYMVSPIDAGADGLMVGVLFVVALIACYIPARRASRTDPLSALRYE